MLVDLCPSVYLPDKIELFQFSELVAFIICSPRGSFMTEHSSLVNGDDLHKGKLILVKVYYCLKD